MQRRLFWGLPVALFTLFLVMASFGTALAAGASVSAPSTQHTVAIPALNVSGTWKFTTTDPGHSSFTLFIQQHGTMLSGHDANGNRLKGGIMGQDIHFLVIGVSSEDNYGGHGTVNSKGTQMQGSFKDGFGGTGTFTATKTG